MPVVPPPFPDERLSSWLARTADVYLTSVEELQAHVGWGRPAIQLERMPVSTDVNRIAQATNVAAGRIMAMTFAEAPERYLKLVRQDSSEMCPACSPGLARPRRLKGWAFAFGFWCERHRRLLFWPGQHGTGMLGNEAAARCGMKLLHDWAMGQDAGAIPVSAAVSLLLSSCREPSPPAPWELARLSEAERKGRGDVFTRSYRRPVLGIIVPEFNKAVPIYDQRLPKSVFALRDVPLAVRYAVAIGIARLLKSPADSLVRILADSDAAGRRRALAQIARWPSTSSRFLRTAGFSGYTGAHRTRFEASDEPRGHNSWKARVWSSMAEFAEIAGFSEQSGPGDPGIGRNLSSGLSRSARRIRICSPDGSRLNRKCETT